MDNTRAPLTVDGNTSDGYHTFNELYHHRAVLFSVICNDRPTQAWKSKLHDDGTMFEGMFIVGIETPGGQATYHYDIDPYWEMFDVSELPHAPKWDGHTPDEAIGRIGKLSRDPLSEEPNEPLMIDELRKMDRLTVRKGKTTHYYDPADGATWEDILLKLALIEDAVEGGNSSPVWIPCSERMPDSGVHVLLCCEVRPIGEKYVCDGYYAKENTIACDASDEVDFNYSEEDDEYYLAEGFYEVVKNWDDFSSIAIGDFVTHWMSLPSSPEVSP